MPDHSKKRLLFNIGLSLSFILFALVALVVLARDIKSQADYTTATRSELKLRLKEINELARLREEAKLAEPKLASLRGFFPKRDELFTFSDDLQSLARDNNLGLSFNFGSEEKGESGESGRAEFTSVVQGSYPGILKFIEGLEEIDYLANLVSFDIIAEGSNSYNATLKGEIFFSD
ncbi:MAG TPA: hypothetical protein VJA63_01220 [Candidatus Paceibacterota bacterium]